MATGSEKEKNPVAAIRERFFERLKNWKPSPELSEAGRQKPVEDNPKVKEPAKKIARPKTKSDLDI